MQSWKLNWLLSLILDPPLTPDQLDLKGSRLPFVHQGLKKFLKRIDQKELFVYHMPCSDTKRPQIVLEALFQWGCHINGIAKGKVCSCFQVLVLEQAITHALAGCSLQEPILQVESDVQGHGLTTCGCGVC